MYMYNSSREEKNETNTICRYQTEGSVYSEFIVTTARRKEKKAKRRTNIQSDLRLP
jgi:hypothetical protein